MTEICTLLGLFGCFEKGTPLFEGLFWHLDQFCEVLWQSCMVLHD
jgi:hypothetical protein